MRRYRMEFRFADSPLRAPRLPDGFFWLAWHRSLLRRHAAVKLAAFHGELDSRVFPALSDVIGCRRLMFDISKHPGFAAEATWLIARRADVAKSNWVGFEDGYSPDWLESSTALEDCGTIQGLSPCKRMGSIQNVGVTPGQRGRGLGRALVLKALDGFRRAGMARIALEVTADNLAAVELYRSIGFRIMRTMYKEVAVAS